MGLLDVSKHCDTVQKQTEKTGYKLIAISLFVYDMNINCGFLNREMAVYLSDNWAAHCTYAN